MIRPLRLFLTLSVLLLSAAPQLRAENLKGFWGKGDATNWKNSPVANSSSDLVYRDYPMEIDKVKAAIKTEDEEFKAMEAAQKKALLQGENPATAAQNQPATEESKSSEPLTREQIIAKYGAPDAARPVRAQKDAPPEMQALFEAINTGDTELAFEYSKALARRSTDTQKLVTKATDYQLLAMEALGMRPAAQIDPEKDRLDPTRVEVRKYMERTQQEQLKKKFDVDQAVKDAEQAQSEDAWSVKAGSTGEGLKQGEIPVDPSGRVNLLIFFDETDPKLKGWVAPLRSLQEKMQEDKNTKIYGLTMRTYAGPGLRKVAAATSFPFPILNGEALALDLRIHRYPTFVFVAPTTKETYRLDGERTPEEIEKVIRLMKGGR